MAINTVKMSLISHQAPFQMVKEMGAIFWVQFSGKNWSSCRLKRDHCCKQFWWSSVYLSRECCTYPVLYALSWLDCHHESVGVCLIYDARWAVISRWKQSSGVVNMHTGASGFRHKHVKLLDIYPTFTSSTKAQARPSVCTLIILYLNPTHILITVYQLVLRLCKLSWYCIQTGLSVSA